VARFAGLIKVPVTWRFSASDLPLRDLKVQFEMAPGRVLPGLRAEKGASAASGKPNGDVST
jgi:hypothetical protein